MLSGKVPDLHARICKTYLDALQLPPTDSTSTAANPVIYCTVYGGVVGLAALGQQVVRSMLLPLLERLLDLPSGECTVTSLLLLVITQ